MRSLIVIILGSFFASTPVFSAAAETEVTSADVDPQLLICTRYFANTPHQPGVSPFDQPRNKVLGALQAAGVFQVGMLDSDAVFFSYVGAKDSHQDQRSREQALANITTQIGAKNIKCEGLSAF